MIPAGIAELAAQGAFGDAQFAGKLVEFDRRVGPDVFTDACEKPGVFRVLHKLSRRVGREEDPRKDGTEQKTRGLG